MTETPSASSASVQPGPTGDAERPQEYIADVSFDSLNLSPELKKAIAERGYVSPTPVQARAYPPVLAGKDLIVRSKTGTGKTAAFGMPIIDRIPMGTREVKALVLCPTRELAMQVGQELESLAKYRDIKVTAIYGGASMKQQEDALDYGSAIIVGTPGRVYDHIRRGNLKLNRAAYAVLDEADEMLNQGFYEEVTRILDCLPKNRQVLLFSATVPEDIQRLIARYTTNAETLLLSGDVYTVDHIKHVRYELSDAFPKPRNLLYMLEIEEPETAIIFCNTRSDTELVTAVLNRAGFDAELLNGDLAQKERERVMAKVKRGEVAYMVATDLAARGIDISDLSHVVNYSLPEDAAVYLHRVGRTGRIGRKGTALNLTSGRELSTLTTLEKKYGIKFEKKAMPNPEEAMKMWTDRHVRELKDAAAGSIFEGYLSLANALKQRPDADDLIAFMLKSFFAHRRMDRAREPGEETPAETPAARPEREARGGRRDERPRREDRGAREDRPRREHREDRPRPESRPQVEVAAPPAPAHAETTAPGVPAVAANIHTVETTPGGAAAVERPASKLSDREVFQQLQKEKAAEAPKGVQAPAAPQAPAGPHKPRLSDRERYEALMRGEPLPPVAEPDESIPPGTVEAREPREGRGRFGRDRGERGERGPRRERDGRRGREDRPHRDERPRHAEAPVGDVNASDAALLKTLHQGAPLPEIADPTTRDVAPSEEGERPGRRRRREPEQLHPLAEGETRLWLNLGRADGVSESTMASTLEAAGAPTGRLKRTELRGTFSYLVVAEEDVGSFVDLAGKPHGEKPLKVERAKR